jgi:hypothetical protein
VGEAQRVGDPVDCVEDECDVDSLGQGDVVDACGTGLLHVFCGQRLRTAGDGVDEMGGRGRLGSEPAVLPVGQHVGVQLLAGDLGVGADAELTAVGAGDHCSEEFTLTD